MFRKCPKPKSCPKPQCKSTHNVLLHGAERFFPTVNQSGYAPHTTAANPAVQTPFRPTTQNNTCGTSLMNLKGLMPLINLTLSSNDSETTALVLCDTASSHSCISPELARRLNLTGRKIDLTVNGANCSEDITSEQVDLNVSSEFDPDISFTVCAYVKNNIYIGSDIINVRRLQEKYSHLEPIDSVEFRYADVEMILGQDVYEYICPLEYCQDKSQKSPFAVRLPIGWVLSGPLPASTGLISTCLHCNIKDVSLVEQVKFWYELESYGTYKQVDARLSDDKRANKILEASTIHDGDRYAVGMLWAEDHSHVPNNYYSALAQLKSMEKRLDGFIRKEDFDKGYVIKVNTHDFTNRSAREWYLPHHPVINPNKPGKVRRVLNGAANFHGSSLKKALLVGPDLLQNLLAVLMRFRQHQHAVSADIEGMFLQVGVSQSTNCHFVFCGGRIPQPMW